MGRRRAARARAGRPRRAHGRGDVLGLGHPDAGAWARPGSTRSATTSARSGPTTPPCAAAGLRRYGFDEDFTEVFEALLEAASHAEAYRLPELFAGFSRTQFETPVPYPVACHPQAWAAGAIPYLLTSGLGLRPDGLERRLRVRRPSLPRWVDRVEVEGLRVADARVDLLFERAATGDHVALTDARIEGEVEVVLEISGSR